MKISICSDIHLEFGDLLIENKDNADVLVLAGDICVASNLSQFSRRDSMQSDSIRRANTIRNFFKNVCDQYKNIIYVLGNHEHYHGVFNETRDILLNEFNQSNLHVKLLENETIVIDGVTFLGCTLWTDFNKGDPITLHEVGRAMNDYNVIRNDRDSYLKLKPQEILNEHNRSKNFILDTLRDIKTPVVVVGHHAPSHLSVKPMYEKDYIINGAYRSDLSDIMLDNENIKLWVHGHTHSCFDYTIGKTRVVCNPRGYVGYERAQQHLEPYYPVTVEIDKY